MIIGLVTLPPKSQGGGGRELFMSILTHLTRGHDVVVITNGQYNQYGIELPPSVLNVNVNEGLDNFKFDYIIFDTEYSFTSFRKFLPDLRRNPVKLVALFHDEYWKKSPLILYRRGVLSLRDCLSLDYFQSLLLSVIQRSLSRRNTVGKIKLLILGLSKSYRRDILDSMHFLDTISVLGEESKLIWEKTIEVFGLNTQVVFNPILFSTSDTELPDSMDTDGSRPFFILHSRIAREKNIEFVLRVFEDYSDRYLLRIVGRVHDEDYFHELKKLIGERGLQSAVFFYLDADSMSLNSYFRNAEIYLCADLADFNIATIKALFAGCPCVVHSTFTKLPEEFLDVEPFIYRSKLSLNLYRRQIKRALEGGRFEPAKSFQHVSNFTRKLINND